MIPLSVERVIEQVHGILGIAGVPFSMSDDKQSFLIASGSARVFLLFRPSGESVVVSVRVYLLDEMDLGGDRPALIHERLNTLNAERFFCKLYLQASGTIVLEYDLLGDELDSKELLHALGTISAQADELDDLLSAEFGTGLKAEEVAKGGETGGTGPVVPA